MKSLPRCPRDVADIEAVLDAHPGLDLTRVRYWVGQFASVLEAPEILDDVERILNRKRRRSIRKLIMIVLGQRALRLQTGVPLGQGYRFSGHMLTYALRRRL